MYGEWAVLENCIEEAKKYKTSGELKKNNPSCYRSMVKCGWFVHTPWLKKRKKRAEGKPQPICQYTLDGKYVREWANAKKAADYFRKPNGSVLCRCCRQEQSQAYGYRWLYKKDADRAEEIFSEFPIKVNLYRTEEEIINDASKYSSKSEFKEKSPRSYDWARRHKILNKLPFERKLNPYKDKLYRVYAYFFNETHSVYVGVTCREERDKEHNGCYKDKSEESAVWKHAVENNLEVPDPVCLEDNLDPETALILENDYREYFRELGWNDLNKAKTGLTSGSLGGLRHISNEHIRKTASECTYLGEYNKKYPNEYRVAWHRGMLHELGLTTILRPAGTHTEESCYNVAMECRSMTEFLEKDSGAYYKSIEEGWYKGYWWLEDNRKPMVAAVKGLKIRVFKTFGKCYDSMKNEFKLTYSGVYSRCIEKGLPCGGYKLHYLKDIDYDIPKFENRF